MSVKGIVVPPDIEEELRVEEFNSLRDYQQAVGGTITFTDLDAARASIVSHDEGLLIGLEFNLRATSLLHHFDPRHIGYTMLVGTCVVVGLADDDGETLSVPDNLLKMLDLEP